MQKIVIFSSVILLIILGWFLKDFYLDFNASKRIQNIQPVPSEKEESSEKAGEPLISTVATGLEVPWALAFLPDGDILVTERIGKVSVINKNGAISLVGQIAQVKQTGEGGLHGITIDPEFSDNKFIYLYYTYGSNGGNTLNRVSRFKFDGNSIFDEKIIVDKIPGASIHDGGRIKFGPDKLLYITTGDGANPSLSQDQNSLAGKILRVNSEDKIEVYSYGHRNPQGITWDDKDRLWSTEHGQTATDEINLIEFGKNYGWPNIRGDEQKQGLQKPILHSGSNTWAPAGVSYFNGSVFFGGLRGQALFQVNLETLEIRQHFKGQFGRIRDVVLGPDNMLYITTSNRDGRGKATKDDDRIIRIDPKKL